MDVPEVSEEIWNMALTCFDGDQNKAVVLLKLLKCFPTTEVKMPSVTMLLPDEE